MRSNSCAALFKGILRTAAGRNVFKIPNEPNETSFVRLDTAGPNCSGFQNNCSLFLWAEQSTELGFSERAFSGIACHATNDQVGEVEPAAATYRLGMIEAEIIFADRTVAIGTMAIIKGTANDPSKIGQVVVELLAGGVGAFAVVMDGVGCSLGEAGHH